MHTTKRTKGIQLNMRVYAGDKEKIGAFKDSLGLSPRDLIFFLMDYYEKNHQRKEEISLPMYRNDNCSKSLSPDPIEKMVFPGEIVYLSDRIYSFAITPEVARAIEMQYKYKINSDWIYDAEALKKADEEFWGKGCIYAPYEPDYGNHNATFWLDHNVTANGEYISVNEFMHPTMLRRDDIPAAMAVWKDISVDECIEFLCWRVKKLGWHLKSIERARDVFFWLLEYFSVSQIFRIITKSAEYTARIALEQDIKGYEAANMLVQCCKSRGQTTIRNEWDCYCYSRPMELPQSELSYHLAYRVLGVDEEAFTSNYSQLLEKLLMLTEKTDENDE